MTTVNSGGTIPITEIYLKLRQMIKSFLRDRLRISLPIFSEFKRIN